MYIAGFFHEWIDFFFFNLDLCLNNMKVFYMELNVNLVHST